jgi:uncharacterized integral membrane protein
MNEMTQRDTPAYRVHDYTTVVIWRAGIFIAITETMRNRAKAPRHMAKGTRRFNV